MSERVLRYYSEFGSRGAKRSAAYRIELLGPGGEAPKEVSLAWESGAVIEWGEVSKTEPVQGSSLTLRLISESDREFVHLYTTEVGVWSARVLRNGDLYWQGTLDAELYEEPYSTCEGYEVELTFSDFGALDRIDFGGSGIMSLRSLIDGALTAAGLPDMALQLSVSTRLATGSTPLTLEELRVNTANFYDEDGEPMSQREVVEGVLQPLGLRMVQRGGVAHIFDLNAAAEGWAREEIYWTGSDSNLGVDKTYNKVKVKLSTYSESGGCDGSIEPDDVEIPGNGYLFAVDAKDDEKLDGFWIYTAGEDVDVPQLQLMHGARLMEIEAGWSGNDCAGFLWNYSKHLRHGDRGDAAINHANDTNKPTLVEAQQDVDWPIVCPGLPVPFVAIAAITGRGMRVDPEFNGSDKHNRKRYIKVSMDLLLDGRYNPFEGDQEWDGYLEEACVPVLVYLTDDAGTPTWFYTNNDHVQKKTRSGGLWKKISENPTEFLNNSCWLSYYDWEDWGHKNALNGWTANRQSTGHQAWVTKAMKKRGDGEFIPLPPEAGYLHLQVGRGVALRGGDGWYIYNTGGEDITELQPIGVYKLEGWWASARSVGKWHNSVRWMAYKNPKIELVGSDGKEAESEDLEDSAWIVKSAAEELSIDTVVGTPGSWALPTSRALLLDAEGKAVKELHRAGVTDRVERLLIGTVYSQYAVRRATLKGHCELLPAMSVLTDASDAGGEYIMLGETQDLAAEESEILCAQFGADDYKGIEMTTGKEE